ncbi:TIGR02594 family protein [Sphingoaurantiacus capsulatus]|uniref:TIGR02594 family protein n=1 Tax=Sphingoaurantiacus capsulatus TaxID=1771310 RepID=A0ABV7X5J9_9SPHN
MDEPRWLARARRNLGVKETPGRASTPSILKYRVMARVLLEGDDGAVPWCAIFVNAMLEAVGVRGSRSGMARSFSRWGKALPKDRIPAGAVVVLSSDRGPASGHVGFACGVSATHVWLLGGNQGDAVSVAPFRRERIVAVVWPGVEPVGPAMALKVAAAGAEVSDA